jgi:hypothetical protein
MPRYFFDIDDGDGSTIDDDGTDFDNLDRARDGAIVALTEIAHDSMPRDGTRKDIVAAIRDDGGTVVLRVVVSLSVTVPK